MDNYVQLFKNMLAPKGKGMADMVHIQLNAF